ncbi:MAG: 2-hydroxy-acid oxidase [delta proteobacterium ML8_F1]|nr:MAG: 2-hydroxy-acid oxidase [delta proteobacterium ML8_F1]
MNYHEARLKTRSFENFSCRSCEICNGIACRGEVPGVGGKGTGSGFTRNFAKIKEVMLQMDTLYEGGAVDTTLEIFGRVFKTPIFAAPVGGLTSAYNDSLSDYEYSRAILEGTLKGGGTGFLADGIAPEQFEGPLRALAEKGGMGIPTIKPWEEEEVFEKITRAREAGAIGIAMDVDAAGLTLLASLGKPVHPKSPSEIARFVEKAGIPFVVKGIMTPGAALKALEAGAYGIVVSNHGGRVLDHTPATIEVLPAIKAAVGDRMKIFIDGGIRTGYDVFKCLALGADGVLIGRPYAIAAFGGGAEAVASYTQQLTGELADAMRMTGALSLKDIDAGKVICDHRLDI